MIVRLGDLQAVYRAQARKKRRNELRRYLINRKGPTSGAFNTVARRLYADGLIDNIGLADAWLASASEAERAALFSEIATALLKV
jgi:SOS response regulatory protein OraA/RecX